MKLTGAQVNGFLASPDPKVRAVLIYGPDVGLVRERAKTIIGSVAQDPKDPFRVVELAAAALRKDPARLVDEVAAMAFGGGRRVVVIPDGGDGISAVVTALLDHDIDTDGALVVIQGGELPPRSSLRKLFEKDSHLATIACYADEGESLDRLIRQNLSQQGKQPSSEAVAYLAAHLGSDRLVTRSELNKLVLYVGDRTEISVDDAIACVGDNAVFSMDDVAYAAAAGNQPQLEVALSRAFQATNSPITLLRSVARHFQRLHLAAGLVNEGQSPGQAIKALRPPVFFKFTGLFQTQIRQWSPQRIGQALEILTQAELDCKISHLPAQAICGRALMRVTQAARARR